MAVFVPVMQRDRLGESGVEVRLGHDLVDAYLRFVAARCRPNTVLAARFDLLVFFSFAGIDPVDVTAGDVLGFVADQRRPRSGNVVRLVDGEGGLSARTVQRRLATLSGLFGYLVATGAMDASPMPSGLTARGASRNQGRGRGSRSVPLIRTPVTMPRLLSPPQARTLLAALLTRRDTAMVLAMLLAGLRRCEVLGLRLGDVHVADRRLHVTAGKGGHERIVPVSGGFLTALAAYLDGERAKAACRDDRVFVVLKGPNRGHGLTAAGLDKILKGAKARAGLPQATCPMLRHTCLTRLINRGMSLEAIAALLGHKSMSMTLTYAKIADRTVANEYFNVTNRIEALYAPAALPADAEGPNMRALREETNTRLVGNGHCTRPQALGCRYETVCQTCAFFATTIEFRHRHRPTRRRPPTRRHHPRTGLRHHPRQPRQYPDLTPITRINRCFFQELILEPEPSDLVFHLGHARTLHWCQGLLRLRVLLPPLVHPVAQGPLVDLQPSSDLGYRPARREHELNRLSLELRRELPSMLGHRPILSSGGNLSKILDTPHRDAGFATARDKGTRTVRERA
jgi:site-specific recombinase XerD